MPHLHFLWLTLSLALLQDVYEQLVEREKRVKGQEASVSAALGERERGLQARQDQLAAELQERERRLRSHEDECLATDRQLTADKAALDCARSDHPFISQSTQQFLHSSLPPSFLHAYASLDHRLT